MKTWNTPVLETLNVAMTESGNIPATYENTDDLHVTIDGLQYCLIQGYVAASGDPNIALFGLTKPYYFDENGNRVTYEGSI